MAVEQKQGFTQLEQLCLEIKEEERARELKQEKKRLKRKKRKNKNAAGDRDEKGNTVPSEEPGVTSTCCVLRPESRGSVHIRSRDPQAWPSIRYNYLDTEDDRRRMIEAVKIQRKIFQASGFDQYRRGELIPGPEVQSDEEILDYVRNYAHSVYHPVGTCKMGNDDMAVVDHELKVHGIEGLRIADASVFPALISGNTNATCIAIAEKLTDMLADSRRVVRNGDVQAVAAAAGCPFHGAASGEETEKPAVEPVAAAESMSESEKSEAAAAGCPVAH